MKCVNPLALNLITVRDLSGRVIEQKRSFFSFKKFVESAQVYLNKSHDSVKDFSYKSTLSYEDFSYTVQQSFSLLTTSGKSYSDSFCPFWRSFSSPSKISLEDAYDDVSITSKSFLVRCRKCSSCILSSVREKTFRVMKEFEYAGSIGCMLTLTYKDEFLPRKSPEGPPVVRYRDVQLFLKRLRKYLFGSHGGYLKYFACCEYAPKTKRPHIHIFLIGYDFGLSALKTNPQAEHTIFRSGTSEVSRCPYYMSKILNKLWPFGRATITEAGSYSANYVAGYTMKKIVRGVTVVDGVPECHYFSTSIGLSWFLKNYTEVFLKGSVILNYLDAPPFPVAIPSYYLRYARIHMPLLYEDFVKKRDLLEPVTFSLDEYRCLQSLASNLQKKFAFIQR